MKRLAVLALAACAACFGETQALTARALVYEVDHERVRALGWAPADATEVEVVAASVATMKRRLPLDASTAVTASPDAREIHVDFKQALPDDQVERMAAAIESLGLFELLLMPTAEQLDELGVDAQDPERVVWLERRRVYIEEESAAVLLPASFAEGFGAGNLGTTSLSLDATGFPALDFELEGPEVAREFEAFTGDHVDVRLAIVIHDEILSAPTIAEPLPGVGMIIGFREESEAEQLVDELRAGHGPFRLVNRIR